MSDLEERIENEIEKQKRLKPSGGKIVIRPTGTERVDLDAVEGGCEGEEEDFYL